jgi:hypothetical protein
MQTLPYEIVANIVTMDAETWLAVVKKVGVLTLHPYIQEFARNKFMTLTFFPDRMEFRCFGKLHRTTGPAVIHNSGRQEWWCNNKLHRPSSYVSRMDGNIGPAIIASDGCIMWYEHNKKHRTHLLSAGGGPAVKYPNGAECWYLHDKLHRPYVGQDSGPALIVRSHDQVYRSEWYCCGNLHRPQSGPNAGPAFFNMYVMRWYEHGKIHRSCSIGPASIYNTGDLYWYEHGRLHRPCMNDDPTTMFDNILERPMNNALSKPLIDGLTLTYDSGESRKYYIYKEH